MRHIPAHLSADALNARRKRSRRRLTTGAAVTVTLGAWSVGYASTGDAAWVITGSGSSATVAAGIAGSLSIAAATPATGLLPNGSKDVTFTVHNPNSFPVRISAAAVSSVAVSGGKDASVCTSSTIAGLTATMDTAAVGTFIRAQDRTVPVEPTDILNDDVGPSVQAALPRLRLA